MRNQSSCFVSGHHFSRAVKNTKELGFSPCVRTKAPISSTPTLVGAPCFSRGELDFSPAEKRLIPRGQALALDFRGQC
jgi:hypothetical protein